VTLQTGVALLAGATLGPLAGAAAMVLYLLAGVAGFSVFTTGAVMGATAGYLLAFVPAAFLTGWLRERRGWLGMATGMCLGEALILLGGATGLCLLKHSAFLPALALGVAPFLFGDALKLVAAAATARLTVPAWRSLLRPR
jgi:biotin transport system substrate-specific component